MTLETAMGNQLNIFVSFQNIRYNFLFLLLLNPVLSRTLLLLHYSPCVFSFLFSIMETIIPFFPYDNILCINQHIFDIDFQFSHFPTYIANALMNSSFLYLLTGIVFNFRSLSLINTQSCLIPST